MVLSGSASIGEAALRRYGIEPPVPQEMRGEGERREHPGKRRVAHAEAARIGSERRHDEAPAVAGEAAPFSKKVASWTARDGRFGTHAYDDKRYASWKDQARYAAFKVMGTRLPLACAIDFALKVYFPIPLSISKRKKELARRGLFRPTVTPDYDNLAKAAADALTGIVIRDDKFIVTARIEKWYSDRPRVEMEVREAELRDLVEPSLALEG